MSRLEQFIRNNRESFDDAEPGDQLWKKLEKQLQPPAEKGRVIAMKYLRWSVAAAVVVLAGIGIFHLASPSKTVQPATTAQQVNSEDSNTRKLIKEINPEQAEEVYHFTRLIELKQQELQQMGKDHPELYKQFVSDIFKLDSSYNSLKKELPDNPNREQLLEAMIMNLRLQTELLNRQLQVIQKVKQVKTNGNESNSKSI
ncbi:MAG: hypothetical protein QM731_11920 [Chitinophagaceae bacterium]